MMMEGLTETAFTGMEPAMETKKKTAVTREWNKVYADPKQAKETKQTDLEEELYDSEEDDYDCED
jgi:hypothetical protein